MKKFIKISLLLDIYGGLLTKKRKDILNFYYNKDYSLNEIANFLKITKQGVRDSLTNGEKTLFYFEKKLKILKNNFKRDLFIKNLIDKYKDNILINKLKKLIYLKYNL